VPPPSGASAYFIAPLAKGVEDMLRSLGSNVASVGRTTSRIFGLVLPLSFRLAAFHTIVAVALSYATALLAVVYAYRKGYGIVGRPELALRLAVKSLASLKGKYNLMVARTHSSR
jgi:hypothetical protein